MTKDSAPPRTAVDNAETNYKCGNEYRSQPYVYYIQLLVTPQTKNFETVSHRGVGVGFFKG
jgi:hypothetical protein